MIKSIGKKCTSLLLATAITVSTAIAVSAAPVAAPQPYGVSVSGKNLSLTRGGKAVTVYELKSADIALTSGKDGNLILCFTDSTGKNRYVSLGKQTSLNVEGSLDSVSTQKSLKSDVSVSLGTTANVANLSVASTNAITVNGKDAALNLSAAANVTVKKGAKVTKTTKSDAKAKITIEKGASAATATVSKTTSNTKKTTTSKSTSKQSASNKSSKIRLKIDPIEGNEGDRLMDLLDELNSNVYAYDPETDDYVEGKCTWNNSRYAEVDDDDRSYSFTFTPDDESYAPIKSKIMIYVDGAFGDITLHIKDSITATEGDRLNDLKNELKDAVEAFDDNGDVVDGSVKWDSSGSTKVSKDRSYKFTFKPKKSSRYKKEEGSIKIVF